MSSVPWNSKQKHVIKARMFWEQRGLCHWCRQPMTIYPRGRTAPKRDFSVATLDHLVPRSKGGGLGRANLVLACKSCNLAKGDTPATLWGGYVPEEPLANGIANDSELAR